jgi:hypothetical protein
VTVLTHLRDTRGYPVCGAYGSATYSARAVSCEACRDTLCSDCIQPITPDGSCGCTCEHCGQHELECTCDDDRCPS